MTKGESRIPAGAAMFALVLLTASAVPAAAADAAATAVSRAGLECLEDLKEARSASADQGLSGGRTLSTLSQAALIFARNDQDEACESVVDGIESYLAISSERLRERGETQTMTMADRLRNARPLESRGPWRGRQLINAAVLTPDGAYLGEVEDVLVTGEGGRRFVLVGDGGLLGREQNLVPIRADRLLVVDDDRLVAPADRRIFADAPRFDAAAIRQAGRVDDWTEEVTRWWESNAATP